MELLQSLILVLVIIELLLGLLEQQHKTIESFLVIHSGSSIFFTFYSWRSTMNKQKTNNQRVETAKESGIDNFASAYNSWANAWCPVWETPPEDQAKAETSASENSQQNGEKA